MFREPSAPRKLLDSSYFWPVGDIYAAISPITLLDTSVAHVLSTGTSKTVLGFTRQRLQGYELNRGIANTYNREIVDGRVSCYSELEAGLKVRSLDRKRWEEGVYYLVGLRNLVLQDAPHKEKRNSLDNLLATCTCPSHHWQSICRPPKKKREMFGDKRTVKSNPSPYAASTLCKHIQYSLHWLSVVYGTFDFGLFGPTEHLTEASRSVIMELSTKSKSSRKKARMADYKLNNRLQEKGVTLRLLKPLNDWVWRG